MGCLDNYKVTQKQDNKFVDKQMAAVKQYQLNEALDGVCEAIEKAFDNEDVYRYPYSELTFVDWGAIFPIPRLQPTEAELEALINISDEDKQTWMDAIEIEDACAQTGIKAALTASKTETTIIRAAMQDDYNNEKIAHDARINNYDWILAGIAATSSNDATAIVAAKTRAITEWDIKETDYLRRISQLNAVIAKYIEIEVANCTTGGA